MSSPAKIDICLNALEHNFRTIVAKVGSTEVAPVVKADAYGIGIQHIVPTLLDIGANCFFVARAIEGVSLRKLIGPDKTIYVLDGFSRDEVSLHSEYWLTPVINCLSQIQILISLLPQSKFALHIDTGMNRLGININDINPLITNKYINNLTFIMSHLSNSDEPNSPQNMNQLERFKLATQPFPTVRKSLAASGGIFLKQDYHFDLVRPGISLYGGGPFGVAHRDIKPVVTLKAKILQIRSVAKGEAIGYGGHFIPNSELQVATLAIGYADGLLRSLSPHGSVFINNQLKPILGRISMDLLTIDATGTGAKVGDWVEILGPNLNIDDQAQNAGTISYELLTRLSSRLDRNVI